MKAAVVGGGIAGLSTAYRLQQLAAERGMALEIQLFERESRLGGKILTDRVDGFIIEGGPDTFVSTKPWGLALARELGLEGRLIGTDMERRKVFVVHRGRLVEMPDGLAMMVPTEVWPVLRSPLLSPIGKIRMGLDLLLPARNGAADESLGTFISRRLGRQVYERLIEPLMSGIYAGDGDRLSLQATFPFLKDWERRYGSLARGALAMRQGRASSAGSNGRRSVFLTPRHGLAELVEALAAALQTVTLHLGSPVQPIRLEGERYLLRTAFTEEQAFDILILAAPAYAGAGLVEGIDADLASDLRSIEYVTSATVSLAFREKDIGHPLNGHGYVIPRREGRPALACTWTSTKFPHRAPEGSVLLRLFFGRAGQEQPELAAEADLIRLARSEVAETMGIHATPLFARSFRWPRAMPQYNLGHPALLQAIDQRMQRWPGLYLAGAAYRGIGIPDCIHSGQQAAEAAINFLAQRDGHR